MRPARGNRAVAAAGLTLLCVLLPALVGGASIDGPPRPGERERLEAALHPERASGPRSRAAEPYYAAALPSARQGGEPVLAQARLANVGALFAVSGLLYLLLSLSRRRTTGLLGCLSLAALPPVWADGAVLRPEVPAAVFAGLAMVLLAGFPRQVARRRGPRVRHWVACAAAMAASGVSIGLAAACVPPAAVLLLVPGGALLLVVGAIVLGAPRVLRRVALPRLPVAAVPRRLFPWVLLGIASLFATQVTLELCVEGQPRATPAGVGLLPAHGLVAAPMLLLAGVGALRLVLGTGLRLDRLRRVAPDTMVVLYAAVLLGQRAFGDGATDALVAAPAFAVLVAEGLTVALVLTVGKLLAGRSHAP